MLNTNNIKQFLGEHFDLIGICPAVTPSGLSDFYRWLDSGYAGEMDYLVDRRDAYAHPENVMDGVRSIIMLGSKYADIDSRTEYFPFVPNQNPGQRNTEQPGNIGRIARYARASGDYHDVIHNKLKMAKKHFAEIQPTAKFRGVVDTAPLLERDFAQLAGLGWRGKNTMLISKTDGSWIFLSALLTDLVLDYDQPQEVDHCGTCTACLDACPTNAFNEPHSLDARKCISYWNIESQNLPEPTIRSQMGNWVFGCDICQEVCPWNRKDAAYALPVQESGQKSANGSEIENRREMVGQNPGWSVEEMIELTQIDDDEFRKRFRKTPFWRSKRRGILRNILIVLGNLQQPRLLPVFQQALENDDSLVRATAAWALGEINGNHSHFTLLKAKEKEQDGLVLREIESALCKTSRGGKNLELASTFARLSLEWMRHPNWRGFSGFLGTTVGKPKEYQAEQARHGLEPVTTM